MEPPGEGAGLLVPRELWRCGSSGTASPSPVGPLLPRCWGGGGAKEGEDAAFPPGLGGHLLFTGEGGGFVGRGGVWFGDRDVGLVAEGGEGALARRQTGGGGGGGGAEQECLIFVEGREEEDDVKDGP